MSSEKREEDPLPPLKLASPFEKNIAKFNKKTCAPDVAFVMEGMEEPLLLHCAILEKASALLSSVFDGESVPVCKYDEEKHVIAWVGAETEDVKLDPIDYRNAMIKALRFLYGEDQTLAFEECPAVLKSLAELVPPGIQELAQVISSFLVECAQKFEDLLDDHPEVKEEEVIKTSNYSFKNRKILTVLLKTNSTPTKELFFSRLDPTKFTFSRDMSSPQLHRHEYSMMINEILQKNTTLTSLHVESFDDGTEGSEAIFETLKTNSTLTEISFDSLDEPEEKKALGEMLKVNSSLKKIDLTGSKLGTDGADHLRDALLVNTTLTELNLSQTLLGPEGARSIGEALTKNTTLARLNLESCELRTNGLQNICQPLKTNTGLVWLNVSRNNIGPDGGNVFGELLDANKCLTSLILSDNQLDDPGSVMLVNGLKRNKILSTLNISGTLIGHEGTAALCDWLKTNNSLTALDLSSNTIGRTRTKMISDMLKNNTTLQKLNLYENHIGDNEAKVLCEGLKSNRSLTYLDVRKNRTEMEGVNAFKAVERESRRLKQLLTSFDRNPEAWAQIGQQVCPIM